MSKIQKIFKNISWLTVSQVINSVCAFFWTIIIARYLGVEKYGIISFAVSFTGIAVIFIDLGMTTYTTREVSRDKDKLKEYVDVIIPFKMVLSVLLFFISGIFLYIIGFNRLTILVTLVFIIEMILMSFTQFISGIFQAYEELKYQSIGCLINCVFLIVCILITISMNLGVLAIAASYVMGYVGFFGFMAVKYLQKFGFPKPKIDFKATGEIVKKAIPFGLTSLFNMIYFWINTVMLSAMAGDYETGIYKAVFNIIMVFTTLFSVYQVVLFPVMSQFFVDKKQLIQKSYEKSIKYLLMITLPICTGIFIYAKPTILLVYNKAYLDAVFPLRISIWTVILLYLNGATILVLNAIDMEKKVTKIYLSGAIVNVILNALLISKYSFNGAAVAKIVSTSFIFIIALIQFLRTEFRPQKKILSDIVKLLIATAAMFVVLKILNLPLFGGIIVGAIVYGLLFFALRTVDETDKHIFGNIIQREKKKK